MPAASFLLQIAGAYYPDIIYSPLARDAVQLKAIACSIISKAADVVITPLSMTYACFEWTAQSSCLHSGFFPIKNID